MSGYSEIRYEQDEDTGVAVLTLDRPQARNALTFTTYDELDAAVRTTTARCLVITAADPAFCSGDDVKQVMAGAGERVASELAREPALTPAADALLHTDVPVIAAVNGAAVGWGMELALMADIRIDSDRGPVRRAVRQTGPVLRRAGPRASGPARRPRAGGRAAVHRAADRGRRGGGHGSRLTRGAPRRAARRRVRAGR